MTVSSIDSSFVNSIAGLNATGSTPPPPPRGDGDHDGSGPRVHRGHGGGMMMHDLMQALSQLGLDPSTTNQAGASTGTSTDSDGDNDNSNAAANAGPNSSVGQALHAFMHSLFQAVRAEATSQSSGGSDNSTNNNQTASAQPPYGNLGTDIQNIIQELASGSSTASDSTISGLQSAYQNLVAALQGGSSSTTGSTTDGTTAAGSQTPSLQDLLQAMLQNLPADRHTGSATVGDAVNTSA